MPNTNYHFDLGNSSTGPVGFCARVIADTPEKALELLKARLPEFVTISDNFGDEYIEVYINSAAITTDDIDDEEPTFST